MKGGVKDYLHLFLREIVFGSEDALVSTLGVMTGVAVGARNTFVILLTAAVLLVVEALSMAAGSYLSSKSAREVFEHRKEQDRSRIAQERLSDHQSLYDALRQKSFSKKQIEHIFSVLVRERSLWVKEVQRGEYRFAPAVSSSPAASGVVMGISYFFAGFAPVLPYLFFSIDKAILYSICLTGIVLFGLGFFKGKVVGGSGLKSGLEMTVISLSAALIGYTIGKSISLFAGIDAY